MTTKDAIKHLSYKISYYKGIDEKWADSVSLDALEIAVRAMAEKRKKGEWIHRYAFRNEREECPESRECSCCGTWFDWDMPRNSFCPNCGADMRERREE